MALNPTIVLQDILIDSTDLDARIHCAALMGDVDSIRKIVAAEPDIVKDVLEFKVRPLGSTPLRLASTGGHVDTVRFLLDHLGANVDSSDFKGQTPLYLAIKGGHKECVKVLLEHGANPDGSLDNVSSPLYMATMYGYFECVLLLLEYGADTNDSKRISFNSSPLPPPPFQENPLASGLYHCYLKSLRMQSSKASIIRQSPLHAAVVYRRQECYAALLLVGGTEPDPRFVEPELPNAIICHQPLAHAFIIRDLPDFFIRWFVLFGGYLWQTDEKGRLVTDLSNAISSSRMVIETYMAHPLSLQNLCRIRIRRCLTRKHLSSISSLPLPTTLINILQYKDEIDEYFQPVNH